MKINKIISGMVSAAAVLSLSVLSAACGGASDTGAATEAAEEKSAAGRRRNLSGREEDSFRAAGGEGSGADPGGTPGRPVFLCLSPHRRRRRAHGRGYARILYPGHRELRRQSLCHRRHRHGGKSGGGEASLFFLGDGVYPDGRGRAFGHRDHILRYRRSHLVRHVQHGKILG